MYKKVLCLMTLVLLLGLVSNASAALDAHWTLEDGSGTTATDSAGTNDGTLTNGPVWTTGAPSGLNPTGGLSFDGTDDYVEATGYQGILGSNARTIAAWINLPTTEATNQYSNVVTFGTNVQNNVGRWQFAINFGNPWIGLAGGFAAVADNAEIADGTWHHIAATLPQGGTLDDIMIYLDGVAQVMYTNQPAKVVNTHDGVVQIGAFAEDAFYLEGLIDDVRIYDVELSAAEVAAIVPEPATVVLLGLGGLALLRRKK